MDGNKGRYTSEHVGDVRTAIEHRVTWFYFLLDEARKKGLDPRGL
jgi:hypothetical protein